MKKKTKQKNDLKKKKVLEDNYIYFLFSIF
jgi:hypothetical protein